MGAQLIRADLQEAEAVKRACAGREVVFHVAAKAGYWGRWESFYQPNVVGTQNVIAACRRQGVAKLIYTSTPSVIANGQHRSGADERLPYPTRFESHYPHTKALAEQLVRAAHSPNLLTVALRPHLIIGPADTQIIPRLIARARAGKIIQVGAGVNQVDLTYIDDAARAHLLAAAALQPGSRVAGPPGQGAVYFISQDEPVALWPWLNELLAGLGLPPVKRKISLPVARGVARVLELAYRLLPLPGEPRLTRFLATELALDHYYNITRAKQDLGYQPQLTMAEATRRVVAYFK